MKHGKRGRQPDEIWKSWPLGLLVFQLALSVALVHLIFAKKRFPLRDTSLVSGPCVLFLYRCAACKAKQHQQIGARRKGFKPCRILHEGQLQGSIPGKVEGPIRRFEACNIIIMITIWRSIYLSVCLSVCLSVYLFIYPSIKQSNKHTYIHTSIHACIHAYMHTYVHTAYMNTCIHAHICADTHTHTHIHTHTGTQKYIQDYISRERNWIDR